MRLGDRAINLNPFALGGLNAGWVFWGIRRTRGQVGFDGGRMKTTPAGLWCRWTPITPPGKKTSGFVSTGAQYRAPTFWERTAMKLGPGPKGA